MRVGEQARKGDRSLSDASSHPEARPTRAPSAHTSHMNFTSSRTELAYNRDDDLNVKGAEQKKERPMTVVRSRTGRVSPQAG